MAVKDFKASQLRTNQIIGSASIPGAPSILIASASSPGVNFEGGGISDSTLMAGVGGDVWLFVSGASGSFGTSADDKGTVLFAGDVVVSGVLRDGDGNVISSERIHGGAGTGTGVGWFGSGADIISTSGSLFIGTANTSNPDINLGSSGSAVFNEQGASVDFRIESNSKTHAFFVSGSTDQVLILSGGAAGSDDEAAGTDVNFFVSGSTNSQGTTTRGTSLFGGDLFVSGSAHLATVETSDINGLALTINATTLEVDSSNTFSIDGVGASNVTTNGALTVSGSTGLNLKADSGTIDIETRLGGIDIDAASTVAIDTSDTSNGIKIGTTTSAVPITIGHTTSEVSVADNLTVGGNLGVNGIVTASLGLSGSLTRLTDGTSYLVAGSNVTITSESNGAVTIASSGGGTPGGGNTQVQFNDGGAFAGDSTFAFNNTTNTLAVENVGVTGGLLVQGAFSGTMISPGTGDNSVQIISGSTKYTAADTFFFVSGNVGTSGKADSGVALFGGDVQISGSVFANKISGSLTHLSDGTSYIVAGNNITVTSQSNGSLVIASVGGSGGGSSNVGWIASGPGRIDTTGSLGVSGTLRVANAIEHIGETGSKINFTPGQVLILSGGAPGSDDPAAGTDIGFFVSGAIGSAQTTVKGTALFGGDVVVSGTLYGEDVHVGQYIYHRGDADTNTFIQFAEDSVGITAGGEQLITVSEAGQDIVKIGDGGDVDFQVRTSGDDNTLYVQGSSDRVGIGTASPASVLHVKESAPTLSIQRESNSNDSTIAFLGSGGNTGAIAHLANTNDLIFKTHNGSTPEEMLRLGSHYGELNRQVILLSGTGLHAGAMQPQQATDIAFFVSGAIGSRGTTDKGTSVFGGDLFASGAIYGTSINTDDINGTALDIDATSLTIDTTSTFSIDGVGASNITTNGILTVSGSTGLNLKSDGGTIDIESRIGGIDIDAASTVAIDTTDTSNGIKVGTATSGVPITIGHSTSETQIGDNLTVAGNLGVNGVVSGSLGLSGSLTRLVDGTSYLVAGDNVTITSESNGQVTIAAAGGGGSGAGVGFFAAGNEIISTTGSIYVGTANTSNPDINLGGDGSAVFNEQSNSVDFRVEAGGKTHAIYVNGANDFVEIGAGGQAFTNQDVSVHLSGTIGTNESPDSAVLVSGDLVVSGAIFGGGAEGISGRELVIASQVITVGNSRGEEFGEDVNFFVSGSIGSKGSTETGTTLFGGDVVVSGSTHLETLETSDINGGALDIDATSLTIDTTSTFSIDGVGTSNITTNGALTVSGSTGLNLKADSGTIDIESRVGGVDIDAASTVAIDTTDTSNGIKLGTGTSGVPITIGHTTSETQVADNLTVAGNLGVNGVVSGSLGLSGSLTRLVDGTSYLIAGSNVTITSASNGSVTIASSGGGGSVAGSDTQVQFNDGGSFGGDAGLVFNKTTDTLTAGTLAATTLSITGGGSVAALSSSYIVPHATQNDILITSGNNVAEATGNDVFLFVTGTVGSKGTTTKGTALFAGDVVVSGSTDILGSQNISNTLNVGGSNGVDVSDGEVSIKNAGSVSNVKFYCESGNAHYTQLQSAPHSEYGGNITLTLPPSTGRLLASSDAKIEEYLYHTDDLDTYLRFTDDSLRLAAGGKVGVRLSEGSTDKTFIGSGYDQVLILSGGAAGSSDESAGGDVALYVSGAIGSRGTSNKGAAVFGGDLVISGSSFALGALSAPIGISGSLTRLTDGTSYLVAGNNVTITSSSNGQVTIASTGGSGGASSNVGWIASGPGRIDTTGSLGVSGTLRVADAIQHIGETANKINFSTGQVLILSGGAAGSSNEATAADVAFYVSGSTGTRGSSVRGTSVFGGDVFVSGAFSTEQPISIVHDSTSTDALLIATTENGADAAPIFSFKRNSSSPANADYLGQIKFKGENDNDEEIVYSKITGKIGDKSDGAEDGIIEFAAKSAGSNAIVARVKKDGFAATSLKSLGESANKIDFDTGQVLILSGGAAGSPNEANGNDVNFFVSGTVGSASSTTKGSALFGGDLVSSGSILPGTDLGSDLGSASRRFGNIYTGDLHLRNERGDWTIVEEPDYLCVINNLTNKKYKMVLEPLDEE